MAPIGNADAYIPLSVPDLSGNETAYVMDCLTSNWISSLGRYVNDFEQKFADYVGCSQAIAVTNGTAALHLALIVAGVGQSADVFVPTVTFVAPINAVRYVNAHPVFVDCDSQTWGLCPDRLQAYIDEYCRFDGHHLFNSLTGRCITAILPVHVYGNACQIQCLKAIADRYNLVLIEDAAEGIGCFDNGRHVGSFGRLGCFSFNGNKALTTGGGGMLVCDDTALAERARHLATTAKTDNFHYSHDQVGYNYRMSNIQAAIGVAQLEHLDTMLRRKAAIFASYQEAFRDLVGVRLFTPAPGCQSNHWFAVVETTKRDELAAAMEDARIQVRPLWELNHRHPMYQSCPKTATPIAEHLQAHVLCLPCHPQMTDADVARVIDALRAASAADAA